ncbi:MAG TPA: hypothetical protein ENH80_05305 [Phycisphaerae bacterium]|nr:hypothetical protein [Phycisphaerae bacterium]HDZ43343.1 hypothetical protein [Phycisphaerae bacterium]
MTKRTLCRTGWMMGTVGGQAILVALMTVVGVAGCRSDRSDSSSATDGMLRWATALNGPVTTVDSPYLQIVLFSNSPRRIRFRLDPDKAPIRIALITPQADRLERELVFHQDTDHLFYRGAVPAGESAEVMRFGVDLRQLFGKLSAGRYEVQVILPAEGYTIAGLPLSEMGDVVSEAVSFDVIEADFQGIIAAHARLPQAWVVRATGAGEATNLATLTNNFLVPIEVPFANPSEEEDTPLPDRPLVPNCKVHMWVASKGHWRHTSDTGRSLQLKAAAPWPFYRLDPGESVRVQLPDQTIWRDGMFYYGIRVSLPADRAENGSRFQEIITAPFLSEDGKVTPLTELDAGSSGGELSNP